MKSQEKISNWQIQNNIHHQLHRCAKITFDSKRTDVIHLQIKTCLIWSQFQTLFWSSTEHRSLLTFVRCLYHQDLGTNVYLIERLSSRVERANSISIIRGQDLSVCHVQKPCWTSACRRLVASTKSGRYNARWLGRDATRRGSFNINGRLSSEPSSSENISKMSRSFKFSIP